MVMLRGGIGILWSKDSFYMLKHLYLFASGKSTLNDSGVDNTFKVSSSTAKNTYVPVPTVPLPHADRKTTNQDICRSNNNISSQNCLTMLIPLQVSNNNLKLQALMHLNLASML